MNTEGLPLPEVHEISFVELMNFCLFYDPSLIRQLLAKPEKDEDEAVLAV